MSLQTPAHLVFNPALNIVARPAVIAQSGKTISISNDTRLKCSFRKGLHNIHMRFERPGCSASLSGIDLTKRDEISLLGYHLTYMGKIEHEGNLTALIFWVQLENKGERE